MDTTPIISLDQKLNATTQHESIDLTSSLLDKWDLQSTSISDNLSPSTSLLLNTSTLIFHIFWQLGVASAPIVIALFTRIDAFSKESVHGGKPIGDTFECIYGLLEFIVVSIHQIEIPWEAIRQTEHSLNERVVKVMVGSFNMSSEVIAGIWVWVMFGLSSCDYRWGLNDKER